MTVVAGPLPWRLAAANIFVPTIGSSVGTDSVACAPCPFVPSDDVMAPLPMVLMWLPTVPETTVTVTWQRPGVSPLFAGIVPPVSESAAVPGAAATTPPHVVVAFAGDAIVTLAGRVSVNAAPVAGSGFGFSRSTVRVDGSPMETVSGVKLLLTATAASELVGARSTATTSAWRHRPRAPSHP